MRTPQEREPISDEVLEEWAEKRCDDAGLLARELRSLRKEPAKVNIGTSVLSRDLVWCECERGLSLSGKWLYCPNCGRKIDQESYASAVEEAKRNGATLFRDTEAVERELRLEAELRELRKDNARLVRMLQQAARELWSAGMHKEAGSIDAAMKGES